MSKPAIANNTGVSKVFTSKDPRDKVYASIGIAGDVSEANLILDYTKSVEEVYIDVVKFHLQCLERPTLLGSGFVAAGHALEFLATSLDVPKD